MHRGAFICLITVCISALPIGEVSLTCGQQVGDTIVPNVPWCGTDQLYKLWRAENYSEKDGCEPLTSSECNLPYHRDQFIPTGAEPVKWIRMMVTILANDDGSSPATTVEAVASAVQTLNDDFLSYGIQFKHWARIVNSTEHRVLEDWSDLSSMKTYTAYEPTRYLNVRVGSGLVAGVGYLPEMIGGISWDQSGMYVAVLAALSHESGHCLGLWHTFKGVEEVPQCGVCGEVVGAEDRNFTGDLCSDTDPTPLNYSCGPPPGVDLCSGLPWPGTDFHNIMGYTSCRSEFTPQQAGRMHCFIDAVLTGWLTEVEIESATPTLGRAPLEVAFTCWTPDPESGVVWQFGDGGVASVRNPTHQFDQPGAYDVTTTVTTGYGEFSNTMEEAIWVHADTVSCTHGDMFGGQGYVDICVRNYLPVVRIEVPVCWDGPTALTLDSVTSVGARGSELPRSSLVSYSYVTRQAAVMLWCDAEEPGLSPGSGSVARLYFSQTGDESSGEVPVVLDDYLQYTPKFRSERGYYAPSTVNGTVNVHCCDGTTGDANGDGAAEPTIGDISAMVDHLFITGIALHCLGEADVNQSGGLNPGAEDITIGDISTLIDHLFITGSELPNCTDAS